MLEGRFKPKRSEASTGSRTVKKAAERPSPLVALARLLGRVAAEQALREKEEKP